MVTFDLNYLVFVPFPHRVIYALGFHHMTFYEEGDNLVI